MRSFAEDGPFELPPEGWADPLDSEKEETAAGKTGDESNLTAKGRVRCVHVCEVRER